MKKETQTRLFDNATEMGGDGYSSADNMPREEVSFFKYANAPAAAHTDQYPDRLPFKGEVTGTEPYGVGDTMPGPDMPVFHDDGLLLPALPTDIGLLLPAVYDNGLLLPY